MLIRPQLVDFKVIGFYLGKVIVGSTYAMLIPLATALIFRELNPAIDYLAGFIFSVLVGSFLQIICFTKKDANWMHGMVVVSLGWLILTMTSAFPLFLSGHYGSYLDAVFETMSGYATTGLSLTQNLDHLSMAHNMWRHLIMFIGGQGIIVVALTFLISGMSGAFRLYVSEARDEKILPNVIHTARFIWSVSMIYLAIGTLVMTIIMLKEGMPLVTSFFHSMWIFMAGWDTGGFAPHSQNILYYHSLALEVVIIFIIILGSFNFRLHYAIWTGDRKEMWKNIEIMVFAFTIITTFAVTAIGLAQNGAYPELVAMFRKGFFQLISGHTGTGYQTIYARQFIHEWGGLAMSGVIIAMGIGGGVCSTTGAIKTLRIGVIFKALQQDVKQLLLPESAVIIQKFHHLKNVILNEKVVRSALMITLAYIALYIFGTFVGMFYGYPLLDSAFESVSAAANVGLSCGITAPQMPTALKVVYIFQMWAGRLEFMAIFSLGAFIWSWWRGKK